jgi:hypothetical protein
MITLSPKRTRKYQTKKKTTTLEGKREYQRQWAREYRKQKKDETEAFIKRSNQLMTYFVVASRKRRKERKEMVLFIKQVVDIVNQPGLSDGKIVKQIKALPMSDEIAALFRSKVSVVRT